MAILNLSIVLAILEASGIWFLRNNRKGRNFFLLGCALLIIVLSSCLHWRLYHGHAGWFGAVIWSLFSSLELFAGIDHLELLGLSHRLYPDFYSAYILLWAMSTVTSVIVVVSTFFQRTLSLHSIVRALKNNRKSTLYIIFGNNNASVKLAEDILKPEKEVEGKRYLVVMTSKQDKAKVRYSILDFIKNAFGAAPRSFVDRVAEETGFADVSSRILVLNNRVSAITPDLGDIRGICSAIGYRSLAKVAKNANVYFMSDNENQNIESSLSFAKAAPEAHVFCHASMDDEAKLYAESCICGNITFVDSSYLAVEYLKKNPEFHPVNFVHVAEDSKGRKLGYVDSDFNSLILGFGETGRLALSFLYSFGAFAAKDRGRSPFKCTIYDKDMDDLVGIFRAATPGVNHSLIDYRNEDAGSQSLSDPAFLSGLNYVVVSLGDDRTNLSVATNLLENIYKAKRGDLSNFVMLVRVLHEDDSSSEIIRFYQNKYWKDGVYHLYSFGGESEIWSEKLISNKEVYDAAAQYLDAYNTANEVMESGQFKKRHDDILQKSAEISGYTGELFLKTLSVINKKKRQESQDIENTTHKYTKMVLCDRTFYDEAKFIRSTYPEHKGGEMNHYTGNNKDAESVFEYLAICEHLRWVASHAMAGFRAVPGSGTDDLMKTHHCMVPYDELNQLDESGKTGLYKHFDWQVVKTSLMQ